MGAGNSSAFKPQNPAFAWLREDQPLPPEDDNRESDLSVWDRCHGTPLDRAVAWYLDQMVEGMTPATSYCSSESETVYYSQQRMLAVFGECTRTNEFHFDLTEGSIEGWLRLYAAAIRCSVEPCERGFVFLGWSHEDPEKAEDDPEKEWGHATALYFDVPSKLQVFVNPSITLIDTSLMDDVFKHLARKHVWIRLFFKRRGGGYPRPRSRTKYHGI
jgi:hypothetical protein